MRNYLVLSFYNYVPVPNAEQFAKDHLEFCQETGVFSRILVADEGINGVVSGSREACTKYMDGLRSTPPFENTEFKIDEADEPALRKTHVRYRQEIVNSGLPQRNIDIKPYEKTAPHLKGEEFRKILESGEAVILDVRSNYETRIGRFKDAVVLDLEHFRDLPDKVKELEGLKDKKLVTYCTGGVKCEKASAFLLEQGFKEVYQLDGGIIKYAAETGGENFEGKCYVFDERVVIDVNKVNPKVISTCKHCGKETARTVNCSNPHCNEQVVMCEACGWENNGACSEICKSDPDVREYNGTGYYSRSDKVF